MLVTVTDATGEEHQVAWQGQDQINDLSGSLGAGAVGNAPVLQQVAAANANRAGFLFQNTSPNAMIVQELDGPIASGFVVQPGAFFPPIPNYPIPTGIIAVAGGPESQQGDTFACRDWQTAPDE